MKKLLITATLAFIATLTFGQLTLDQTYNYSTSIVKLESQGYKYYLMDVPNERCQIYNMDHTLFKTINCNIPNGYYLSDIKYVSENLFNNDSQIEIVYTYYKYVTTTNSYYYSYGTRIGNENGTILQPIDNAGFVQVNKTGDTEYKLFAYCYDYSVYPEKVWTNIYNLPGSLYSSVAISENNSDLLLKSYPNPAVDIVKVEYQLPEHVSTGNLYLFDSHGQAVNNYIIDRHSDHLALNVTGLSKGIYHFFIEYGNNRSESKKIIVQ
jgi:hypothetical protein